jgi:hypothetical protein
MLKIRFVFSNILMGVFRKIVWNYIGGKRRKIGVLWFRSLDGWKVNNRIILMIRLEFRDLLI